MAFWTKRRKEPSDRHREFIYLDEVSVISLLAGLQGEIKDAVTETLARTEDRGLTASLGVTKAGAGLESRLGTSRTSTNEVVRRAVIQSTFRDLWRRDVGVLLHDTAGVKTKARAPLHSQRKLENALPRLKKSKLAVPLNAINRGDIVEMDVKIEADQLFKMITVGTTFLDLMNGREDLFGLSATDLRQVEPMIEVFKELLVGLVPMRGVSTSHSVVEVSDELVVIATELLGTEIRTGARQLELVGFAEANSFWRDLRRTLFSGSTFTVYARAEGPVLTAPWSPVKIADLLASVSPELRDEVVLPLQHLDFDRSSEVAAPDPTAIARFRLTNFAAALLEATNGRGSAAPVPQIVEEAIPALAAATSMDEQRRAFEQVARGVAGDDVDRELVLDTRSAWLDAVPPEPDTPSAPALLPPDSPSPAQLEVGFVALYW